MDRIAAAVAKNPKLAGSGQLLRAKVHLVAAEYEQAEKALLNALEAMPDNQTVYMLLAGLYRKNNQVPKAIEKLEQSLARNPKGDPFEVARIAGIQAAKRTWELIPMCHPIV